MVGGPRRVKRVEAHVTPSCRAVSPLKSAQAVDVQQGETLFSKLTDVAGALILPYGRIEVMQSVG